VPTLHLKFTQQPCFIKQAIFESNMGEHHLNLKLNLVQSIEMHKPKSKFDIINYTHQKLWEINW